jgi:hypothetical protein
VSEFPQFNFDALLKAAADSTAPSAWWATDGIAEAHEESHESGACSWCISSRASLRVIVQCTIQFQSKFGSHSLAILFCIIVPVTERCREFTRFLSASADLRAARHIVIVGHSQFFRVWTRQSKMANLEFRTFDPTHFR